MSFFSGVLKNKNFSRLYLAGASSELGSFITDTALVLLIFDVASGDKSYLGMVRATFLIFLTLGSLLGGPIGQRYNRKKVLLACELFRIPFILLLAFSQSIEAILTAEIGIAFFTGVFKPCRQALINEVVPQDEIRKANSLYGSTLAIIHLIGPIAGAFLYSFFNGIQWIIVGDFFTYLIGLYLLSLISYRVTVRNKESETSFGQDLLKGIDFVFKERKDILCLILNTIAAGLSIGILLPMLVPFTVEVLGKDKEAYGMIMACFGLGGMSGGLLSDKLTKWIPSNKQVILTVLIETLTFFLWIQVSNYFLSLFTITLWGTIVFIRITSQLNYISETVPTEYLSRTHSLIEMSFIIPNVLCGLFITFFGDQFSTMTLLQAASVIFFLLTFSRIGMKDFRSLWSGHQSKVKRDTFI